MIKFKVTYVFITLSLKFYFNCKHCLNDTFNAIELYTFYYSLTKMQIAKENFGKPNRCENNENKFRLEMKQII